MTGTEGGYAHFGHGRLVISSFPASVLPGARLSPVNEKRGIRGVRSEHEHAVFFRELVPVGKEERDKKYETASEGDDDVEICRTVHRNRSNRRSEPQNPEYVENIGSDHVADGDVGMSFFGRNDRRDQFWQRGSYRDDGKPDEYFRHSGDFGDVDRPGYERLSSSHESSQTNERETDGSEVSVRRGVLDFFRNVVLFRHRETVDVVHEYREESQENEAVAQSEDVFVGVSKNDVVAHDEEHDHGKDDQWDFLPRRAFLYFEIGDDRARAKNQQDVRRIAPYDVAKRDVGVSFQSRREADDELRCGSSESHDGEPYDYGGNAGSF